MSAIKVFKLVQEEREWEGEIRWYGTFDIPINLDPISQIKPKNPPIFKGKKGEDPMSWLECYGNIENYNRWGNEELRNNFWVCI